MNSGCAPRRSKLRDPAPWAFPPRPARCPSRSGEPDHAVPNDALAAVRQLEIGVRTQERRELGLHRLLDQPLRARAQDFGQRVVDFVF